MPSVSGSPSFLPATATASKLPSSGLLRLGLPSHLPEPLLTIAKPSTSYLFPYYPTLETWWFAFPFSFSSSESRNVILVRTVVVASATNVPLYRCSVWSETRQYLDAHHQAMFFSPALKCKVPATPGVGHFNARNQVVRNQTELIPKEFPRAKGSGLLTKTRRQLLPTRPSVPMENWWPSCFPRP